MSASAQINILFPFTGVVLPSNFWAIALTSPGNTPVYGTLFDEGDNMIALQSGSRLLLTPFWIIPFQGIPPGIRKLRVSPVLLPTGDQEVTFMVV